MALIRELAAPLTVELRSGADWDLWIGANLDTGEAFDVGPDFVVVNSYVSGGVYKTSDLDTEIEALTVSFPQDDVGDPPNEVTLTLTNAQVDTLEALAVDLTIIIDHEDGDSVLSPWLTGPFKIQDRGQTARRGSGQAQQARVGQNSDVILRIK